MLLIEGRKYSGLHQHRSVFKFETQTRLNRAEGPNLKHFSEKKGRISVVAQAISGSQVKKNLVMLVTER